VQNKEESLYWWMY